MTQAGEAVDDISEVRGKTATTVAFDPRPHQPRRAQRAVPVRRARPGTRWFLWDRLFSGTLGAVVLVDTRRIDDPGTPSTAWAPRHAVHRRLQRLRRTPAPPEAVREALDLDRGCRWSSATPGPRESGKQVLIALVEHPLQARYAAQRPDRSSCEHRRHRRHRRPDAVPLGGPRFQTEPRPAVPADAARARCRRPGAAGRGRPGLAGTRLSRTAPGDRRSGCCSARGTPTLWNQWDDIPDDWPLLPMIDVAAAVDLTRSANGTANAPP